MFTFSSSPTVSCVVFPAQAPSTEPSTEVFLSVSEDYSVGKMVRSGRDAVHGIGKRGQRVYDSALLRRYLFQIDDHIKLFRWTYQGWTIGVRQGNGNIGLNNWAVAYVDSRVKETDIPELIVPRGEVIHERLYPSFLKTSAPAPVEYNLLDLVYLWVGPVDKAVYQEDINRDILANPDREMGDDLLYLPVWDGDQGPVGKDREIVIIVTGSGQRIKWPLGTRFVQVHRNCRGTLDATHIRAVPVCEVHNKETAYILGKPLSELRYAFFGIPVHRLVPKRVQPKSAPPALPELDKILHYFYDLRHVFDLAPIPNIQPIPDLRLEYNLFEYELKANEFQEAHQLLSGTPRSLTIDLDNLGNTKLDTNGHPRVKDAVISLNKNPADLGTILKGKGYQEVDAPGKVQGPGQFHVSSTGTNNPKTILSVLPQRDTYSYSFIGLVQGKLRDSGTQDTTFVVLAVTQGISGIRPGTIGAQQVYSAPIAYGFPIEEAVARIERQLQGMFQQGWEFTDGEEGEGLLLLDQGGDVHQWVGAGAVGPVVGSSEGRSFMSAELIVARR